MRIFKLTTFAGIAMSIAVTASLANADPKPKNSKRADSQSVANFYAGSTRIWKSCNGGGVYLGGGWEAKSYCNKNSESVGIGKWSVKKGVICTDLVFYWKDGAEVKSKPNDSPDCIAHIVDANGKMWRRWNDDADWWSLQDIKADNGASKGFKFKSKFNRTSKKLGL
jgi:hypothetical protein